jgi:hypothetical protein
MMEMGFSKLVVCAFPLLFAEILSACSAFHTHENDADVRDAVTDSDINADSGGNEPCENAATHSIDILIVWDNSGIGETLQERFLESLHALEDEVPSNSDIHVAALTTDMGSGDHPNAMCDEIGEDGILRECSISGEYFVEGKGEVVRNYLDCVLPESETGCAFEMFFEAAWRALSIHSQSGGENDGFLRQDSIIVIVFVGNEDDCSTDDFSIFDPSNESLGSLNTRCGLYNDRLTDIQLYIERFRSLRPGCPERVVTAAVTGVAEDWRGNLDAPELEPTIDEGERNCLIRVCYGDQPDIWADPAPRIAEFVATITGNTTIASACAEDYVQALTDLGQRISNLSNQSRQ